MTTRNFGRRASPDDKDHQFLMRRMLAAPGTVLPTRKSWKIAGRSLDQGDTGTCVGHGWKNFLRCEPMRTEKGPSAFDIYRGAVAVDDWSDNDDEANLVDGDPGMDSGTSVRAGAEAVTAKGRLKSFVWAFELQPTIEWLLTRGPVVAGTNWYSSMMDTNAEGICRITPGAHVTGGHAFLIRGADTKRALATCEQSWGEDWGKKGVFYLPFADLERLIHEDGEICAAVEQKLAPKIIVPPKPPPLVVPA